MDKRDNGMDQFLKNTFSGANSPLPEGMLDRILLENKRKKRVVFWWVSTVVCCTFILLVFAIFNWVGNSKNAKLTVSKINVNRENNIRNRNTDSGHVANKGTSETIDKNYNGIAKNRNDLIAAAYANDGQLPKIIASNTGKDPGINSQDAKAIEDPNIILRDTIAKIVIKGPDIIKEAERVEKPVVINDSTKPKEEIKITKSNPGPIDSSVKLNPVLPDLNTSKGGNKSKNQSDFRIENPEVLFTLSYINEQQKLNLNIHESDSVQYFHRDYASLVKSTVKPITGVSFSLGVQGTFLEKIKLQAGFQFAQTVNTIHYSYFVKDEPEVTPDGRIQGYSIVPDSFRYQFDQTRTLKIQTISVPLQIGYIQKIGSKNEMVGSVGITPQIKYGDNIVLPGRTDLTNLSIVKAGKTMNVPATISLGFYRKTGNFKFGITGRINPMVTKNNFDTVALSRRKFELGFVIGMKI